MKINIWCHLLSSSIVAFVFSLAGCGSSEPTEAEIFEAMNGADQNHRMFGDLMKLKAETQKDGCEKAAQNTYRCGIVRKDGTGMVLPPLRFTNVDGKWKLSL